MSLLDAVKRANRPGPPENSAPLRLACAGAVVTGIAACRAEGELSWAVALSSMVLVTVGMYFSYRTRARPIGWLKPLLALAAVAAFLWFFRQLTGQELYDVSTVEDPLAVLFVWIQVAHAFDVPARRDLAFSLAGSASLMAVAAAQAVDLGFGLYAVVWIGFGLWGLVRMWGSASDGGRIGGRGIVATVAAVLVLAVAVLTVLPAPQVAGRIDFPANSAGGAGLPGAGGLTGDAGRATEPARAGSSSGPTRVGGFLGFATHLDTALRGSLGNTVVMRVRAQRPSYWIGETFDTWDGESWKVPPKSSPIALYSGSPFPVPPAVDSPQVNDPPAGQSDLQTFYMAQSSPNLIFHADNAAEVWFPARNIYISGNDTIVSPIALGPGAIYTVRSVVDTPTAAQLEAVTGSPASTETPGQAKALRRDLQLPHPYGRVQALAERITATDKTTDAKVQALIAWIGAHTHYSTDIPPLPPGADTVDEFLFGNRTGFCEQISTAMAVMLRSIGIPAREAVGYVPGSYNPITDLYEVQGKDAHAWVQVWFPHYGWQSFDPTAVVPLANPSPGLTLVHDAAHALRQLPLVPLGVALAVAVVTALVIRRRRRRPATWAIAVARRMERAGGRAGRRRRPGETITEYASALDAMGGDTSGTWSALAWLVEASAYGQQEPSDEERRRAERISRTIRPDRRRAGDPRAPDLVGAATVTPAAVPAPRRGSPGPPPGDAGPSAGGDG
ncbi:MAG TPA: transglutaminaseTgpA domain-containing protein [Acidimicrobiales bacterium]|nr:transglutaminaseTgpA domain-containing protein [Acidimicrobiales bacterium]